MSMSLVSYSLSLLSLLLSHLTAAEASLYIFNENKYVIILRSNSHGKVSN